MRSQYLQSAALAVVLAIGGAGACSAAALQTPSGDSSPQTDAPLQDPSADNASTVVPSKEFSDDEAPPRLSRDEIAKDIFGAIYIAVNSGGKSAQEEIAFSDSDAFDNQLFASLAAKEKLERVHVTFKDGAGETLPDRTKKWIGVSAVLNGPGRVCNVNTSQSGVLGTIWKILKVASKVAPVKQYKVIVEYDSGSDEFVGLLFYRKKLDSAKIESEYGKCRDLELGDVVS